VRQVPLPNGRFALVDDDDYDRVMAAGPWYAIRPNGVQTYAVREHRAPDGHRTAAAVEHFGEYAFTNQDMGLLDGAA
jgi:hypothetical protein